MKNAAKCQAVISRTGNLSAVGNGFFINDIKVNVEISEEICYRVARISGVAKKQHTGD